MPEYDPSLPTNVGIVGGGRMGSGIAHVFLLAGSSVRVIESSDATVNEVADRIEKNLAKAAERGDLDEPLTDTTDRVTVTSSISDLDGLDLVIEAVPENLGLKQKVLTAITEINSTCALGTNTSSLSVDAMAENLPDPARLIGLHFFNPVPVSHLVEIVVGSRTDPALAESAKSWVEALGKTAITVRDTPGFASSRLGVGLALEAMRMLESEVASATDIDTAMVLGYKHPLGPLRTTDLVGLDVRLAIAEHLASTLGDRFEPPQILRAKVAEGHLGKKTGQGFYTW